MLAEPLKSLIGKERTNAQNRKEILLEKENDKEIQKGKEKKIRARQECPSVALCLLRKVATLGGRPDCTHLSIFSLST